MGSHIQTVALLILPIAGVMFLAWSAVSLYLDLKGGDRRKIVQRMQEQASLKGEEAVKKSILRQTKLASTQGYERFLQKVNIIRKIQRMLDQGNIPWSAPRFLVNLLGASALALILCLLITRTVLISSVVGLITFFLPLIIINIKRKMRMKKLVEQLPDIFELISQALRAGHSLASGIQLVGKQMPDPAAIEFARVFHEQNLGIKIEDALKHMADRIGQLDVGLFVTAVLIQRQTGGDLAEVLTKIGGVIRGRIEVMGQVRALTAEGRMSGVVLCALPVVVFMASYSMNPDYAGVLLYEKEGQYLLGAGIVCQILGMLIIKKIVNIKI